MRISTLLAIVGTAVAASSACAQYNTTVPGPYVLGPATTYVGVNLNGPAIPANTYLKVTLRVDWVSNPDNNGGFDPIWQSDQRFGLHNADATGLGTIVGGAAYGGGTGGYFTTTGAGSNANGTIIFNNQTLTTAFVADGVNQCWLALRNGYNGDGGGTWSNLQVTLIPALPPPPPVPCPGSTESEPNDSKTTANTLASTVGSSICGTSTGTSITVPGVGSADYFKITTAQHTGIVRHTAKLITNNTVIPTLSLVGLTQTAGVPGTGESTLQTARANGNDRLVDWYTIGNDTSNDARSVYAKVTGTVETTSNYNLSIDSATPVVPAPLSRNLTAGSVTISTVGTTAPGQTDTDLWVLDSNFNLIADWGNDDEPTPGTTLGSKLTRTFADGTYYLALGVYQMSVNLGSPSDDRFRTGSLADFPGVIVESVSALQDRTFTITDSTGSVLTPAVATQPFEILFFKLQVGSDTPSLRCQPADIAYGNGDPLPPFGAAGGFNPGVDGGDFDCFFNFYFEAAPTNAVCDIADGVGDPLPPFGPGTGFNPGVDGGDFDCFFNFYFNGCP